jgi:hypothetical protein
MVVEINTTKNIGGTIIRERDTEDVRGKLVQMAVYTTEAERTGLGLNRDLVPERLARKWSMR